MNTKKLNIINDLSGIDSTTIKYQGNNTGVFGGDGGFSTIFGCKSYVQAINYGWHCPRVNGQNFRQRVQSDNNWARTTWCDNNGPAEGQDRINRLTAYGCVLKTGLNGWMWAQDDDSCALEGDGGDFCCPHWQCPGDCGSQFGNVWNGCEYCDCGDAVYGCMDPQACNYNSNAELEYSPSNCEYPSTCYDCQGNCICSLDGCGVCNGTCNSSCDCGWCGSVMDCDGNCNGSTVDECGVCNGNGANYQCFNGDMVCSASDCPSYAASNWVFDSSNGEHCDSVCASIGQHAQGDIWVENSGDANFPLVNCGGVCEPGYICTDGFRGTSEVDSLPFSTNSAMHDTVFPYACDPIEFSQTQLDYNWGSDYVYGDLCFWINGYCRGLGYCQDLDFQGITAPEQCPPTRGGTVIKVESNGLLLPWWYPNNGFNTNEPVLGIGGDYANWQYHTGYDRHCCCGGNPEIQCEFYVPGERNDGGGQWISNSVKIPIQMMNHERGQNTKDSDSLN